MVSRALRETITRRPVTMPVAGRPGDFAVLTAPEALPGFEHVTAGRPWRNQISTSWLFPLAAFRPVTAVPRITAPVLYQIAQHDGMPTTGQVDKAIPRTPRAEVRRYPWTTSALSAPNTTLLSPPTPAIFSAPTSRHEPHPARYPDLRWAVAPSGIRGCRPPCPDLPGGLWVISQQARDAPAERRRHRDALKSG